ncbi:MULTISPECIES: AAA family ATPase [unclassified Bradyrhizobium]|uniref:AAA family ATPase n=1 Tax=unclassified Bradyrhizobium TaxID=2631580 RepID=UPI0028E334A6|nr:MULTISPECIES: AAA family ATPase [unclassified Bradyrhizobium]
MQIRQFRCNNLNAFLSYDIKFFEDVSFLHGINGSGKTSVLRAIASLLTPDPLWLLNSTFDRISVDLEHHAQTFTITANSSAKFVHLQISGGIEISDELPIDELSALLKTPEDEYWRPPPSAYEEFNARTRALLERFKTFSFISGLPTPIFLGLDRTTLSPLSQARAQRGARARTVSPYFRTSLDDALYEAERLVTRQLNELSNERNRIFEELRNQFALSLFQSPSSEGRGEALNRPSITRINRMRASVIPALQKISISREQIDQTVEPFFRELLAAAELAATAPEVGPDATNFDDYIATVGPYLAFRPSISIIERAVEKIEAANTRESIISRPIETYQTIMNDFFGDSAKSLVFEQNAVRVKLPSGVNADITALSSGERQIFVLITHLLFNPLMRHENILLIDEPELSLHLKWQRQFVPAIRTASPSIQMILATHSPEIIFDMDEKLIPLEI